MGGETGEEREEERREKGAHQHRRQAERAEFVQSGEEKAPGRACSLPVLKGAYRKDDEGLFIRDQSGRAKGNKF